MLPVGLFLLYHTVASISILMPYDKIEEIEDTIHAINH